MTTGSRRAITALALGSFLFLSGCTKWAEKKNPNWRQATSGEHLVNLFWKDIENKNWKQLEAHVAPEFAGVNSMQTMDRAAFMNHVSRFDLQSFQIGEVETRSAGRDLIVAYVITLQGNSSSGRLPTTPMRILSVWQELRHGWFLVAMSATSASQHP